MVENDKYTKRLQATVDLVNKLLKLGFKLGGSPSVAVEISRRTGVSRRTVQSRMAAAKRKGYEFHELEDVPYPEGMEVRPFQDITSDVRKFLARKPRTLAELIKETDTTEGHVRDALDTLLDEGINIIQVGDRFDIARNFQPSYVGGELPVFMSGKDNSFKFGCVGDNHAGSKYSRVDVLEDLYDMFEANGVKHVYHCGNWIEGESRFNKYDLEIAGLDGQCQLLADTYPMRPGITTFAVWGDDHEGWYAQREGMDVGAYCEGVMVRNGRDDWKNLGFMEAHIELQNANTGVSAHMSVTHQGGGTGYATSYRPQKIIESLEGGEKPAILLIGHYHKLDPGLVRNVWYLQVGTTQDQTPFMRKKALEAHVGGALVECVQCSKTGAIMEFTPRMRRYFNKEFYSQKGLNNRWSHSGPVSHPKKTAMGQ